jgi:5-methylcytosine-specific restriction enzyme subunit McrC
MQTDISLESSERKIIIDTKFYSKTLSNQFDSEKIHSHNLYQMYAYLKQGEYKNELSKTSEGIILYPKVDKELISKVTLENHKITIATIDLNQNWQRIHENLLDLLK